MAKSEHPKTALSQSRLHPPAPRCFTKPLALEAYSYLCGSQFTAPGIDDARCFAEVKEVAGLRVPKSVLKGRAKLGWMKSGSEAGFHLFF